MGSGGEGRPGDHRPAGLGGRAARTLESGRRAGSAFLSLRCTLGTPCWSPPCSGMRAARRLPAHSRASGKNAGAAEPRPTREGCSGRSGGLAGRRARPHTCPGWGGNAVEGGPCQPQHRVAAPVLPEGKLPAQEGQHGPGEGGLRPPPHQRIRAHLAPKHPAGLRTEGREVSGGGRAPGLGSPWAPRWALDKEHTLVNCCREGPWRAGTGPPTGPQVQRRALTQAPTQCGPGRAGRPSGAGWSCPAT